MNTSSPSELVSVAAEIAREAGAEIRTRVPSPRQIATKANSVDLVTDTDHRIDALISERLAAAFPDHARLTEETGATTTGAEAPVCWVVDPLDGTVNFAHGVPHFAVSIAAVRGFQPGDPLETPSTGAEILAGVVYDPMRDELFEATAAGPAKLNGEPIQTSPCASLSEALVASGFPYDRRERADEYLEDWKALLPRCRDLRRAGAAALDLAYVAAGRFDAYWERGLHAWDIAAGVLIVRRAGGIATNRAGRDLFLDASEVLAAPTAIHAELLTVL
ncbi:MAG: inositol monophosphatase family protein [Candidatus Binatia bacterium]|nr:inositol monophosphatase family protein [Candidatus Binatia bacterium]